MSSPFTKLGLPEFLADTVSELGYVNPTPVQTKAIPLILSGRNLIATAQTGTGKTAAFALPLIALMSEHPKAPRPGSTRALVLSPTRELAEQIGKNIAAYLGSDRSVATIIGGANSSAQMAKIAEGVVFIVATPGRLIDLTTRRSIDLSRIEYLVLDEADRMLDEGFKRDVLGICARMKSCRQKLLFSATVTEDIREVAKELLDRYTLIDLSENRKSDLVTHKAYCINTRRRHEFLRDQIVDNRWNKVLVFTGTRFDAEKLADQLFNDGIKALAIHSEKTQAARSRALAAFKEGDLTALVATDVAARGLDITGLPQVFNYDLPGNIEDYVHRIGRTGRAGVPGKAISVISRDQIPFLEKIGEFISARIPVEYVSAYDGDLPEDLAEDEERRRKARIREKNREKAKNAAKRDPRKKPSANVFEAVPDRVAESSNPDDRFEMKIVRKPQSAGQDRRPSGGFGNRPQGRPGDRSRTPQNNRRFKK